MKFPLTLACSFLEMQSFFIGILVMSHGLGTVDYMGRTDLMRYNAWRYV